MNRFLTLGAVLAVSAMCTADLAAQAKPADPTKAVIRANKEFTVRGGLPNFYKKLADGKHVKIAYFGGSITAQNGWRPQSLDYFRKLYPKAKVDQINAAIGGTGSALGAFRIEHDVLRHKPDLVFVEFAVNDAGTGPVGIRRAMEGIVRHIWRALPETDICFVYTFTANDLQNLLKGKMKRSTSVMEDVADYYNIPSIHMGLGAVELARQGKLIMKADSKGMTKVSGKDLNISADVPITKDGKIPFSKDGVHPYENTGHVLYTNALKKALPEIAKAGKPATHLPLPAPVMKDNYEFSKVVSLDAPGIKLSGPVVKQTDKDIPARSFMNRMPGIWKLAPGATIEFKFKGTMASLYNLIGPGCGLMEITVDGQKPRNARLFDPYCTYYRIANMGLLGLSADKVHTVKIKILDQTFDKRKILFKHNQPDFDKNPQKYAGKDAYIGAIFILGDIVK